MRILFEHLTFDFLFCPYPCRGSLCSQPYLRRDFPALTTTNVPQALHLPGRRHQHRPDRFLLRAKRRLALRQWHGRRRQPLRLADSRGLHLGGPGRLRRRGAELGPLRRRRRLRQHSERHRGDRGFAYLHAEFRGLRRVPVQAGEHLRQRGWEPEGATWRRWRAGGGCGYCCRSVLGLTDDQ